MAWLNDPTFVNQTPASGDAATWRFLQCLVAAGWLYEWSWDGVAGAAQDDHLAPTGAGIFANGSAGGANGWGNNGAWAVLVSPATFGGVKQRLTVWRGGASNQLRFGRVLGSVSTPILPHMPTPTAPIVETLLWGGGVIGVNESAAQFWGADSTYKTHQNADSTSGMFWLVAIDNGGANTRATFIYDQIVAGSGPAGDFDQFAFLVDGSAQNGTNDFQYNYVGNAGAWGSPEFWLGKTGNDGSGQFVRGSGAWPMDTNYRFSADNPGGGQTGIGVDLVTLKETLPPMIYGRPTAWGGGVATGWKGVGTCFRWLGSQHATGELLTITNPGDALAIRQCALTPWPSGTPFVP